MTGLTLEERVAALEMKWGQFEQKQGATVTVPAPVQDGLPWWERIRGTFKDDPAYAEAMRLGREYREALRPAEGERD